MNMIAVVVGLALVALTVANPVLYASSRCKFNGQFLSDPKDTCKFRRCDYGDEPWHIDGKIVLFEVEMHCAAGSANEHKFNPEHPCGVLTDVCKKTHKHLKCEFNGQFLPDLHDVCKFKRCDYGDEPWYDVHGNIVLVQVEMSCAPGSVNAPHPLFNPQHPCGIISDQCKAPHPHVPHH